MAAPHTLDMTTGPIVKKLTLYAYPLLIRHLINTMYSTVDKVVAGKCIGSAAMASVGAASLPLNLMFTLFTGLALGVSVCCGNYLGAKNNRAYRECVHTVIPLGFLGGLFVCLIGLFLSEPLLLVLNTPVSVLPGALSYMRIRTFSHPLSLMNDFCCSVMNARGDTKTPTIASFISGFVNAVLDLVFVLGFGMDVEGLAWATYLSHATDTLIFAWVFFRPKSSYGLRLSEFRLHMTHIRKICAVGIPNGLNNIVFTLSNMVLQSSINAFGETVIAANTAAASCSSYVQLVLQSLNSACVCAAAQCYGARNYQRIRLVIRKSISLSLGVTLLACIAVTCFIRPLLGIYTSDLAVIEAGIPFVMFNCWGYLLFTFGSIHGAALKGIRKSSATMVCNLFSMCVPKVLWVLLVMPHFPSPIVLFCVYPISWLISSVLLSILFRHHYKQLTAQTV